MAKEKKPLTIKEKYKRKLGGARALRIAEFPVVATPYGIMAIVNADTWFVENSGGWKIGLGGALGIVLLLLATFLIGKKKKEENQTTNGMISLLIIWYAIAFVFMLLAQINTEIYKIMMWGGLGIAGALGLNIGSEKMFEEANKIKEAMDLAKIELDKEQAKKEIIPTD